MKTNRFRRAWPLAASLFATALLAFSLGALATAWAVVEAGAQPRSMVAPDADMASEPSWLRFAMVPPVRVAAAEAAVLLPEIFLLGMEARAPEAPEQDAYTLQFGMFLLPQRAEEAGREAVAKGKRIFQTKSAVEIIKAVFDGAGYKDYKDSQAALPRDRFVPWQKLQLGGQGMQRGMLSDQRRSQAPEQQAPAKRKTKAEVKPANSSNLKSET